MFRWTLRAPLLALLLGLLARPGAGAEPESRPRPFGLRDTSKARFKVDETRRLLEEREWERAFVLAQEAIEELPNDFYLVEQREESERWRPASALVRDMLLSLPPEGRTRYDEAMAFRAEPLVQRALAAGGDEPLKELWRRFGTGKHGLEAARLLVELALEGGRTRDAAALAKEALRTAPEDAGLWLRLVQSLADAGDGAALAGLRPPAGLSVKVGGKAVLLEDFLQQAKTRVPPPAPPRGRPMWGGRPSRDLPFPGEGARAVSLRWSERTALELRERDVARVWPAGEGDQHEFFTEHLDAYRPTFPAAEGGLVFVSDGRSLRALDQLSGRPAWVFDSTTAPIPLLKRGATAHGRTALDRAFAPTLWRDLVIATIELDRPYHPDWLMNVLINTYLPRRALVAVDRQRGTLRWMAGSNSRDALLLDDVSFASEAVVAEDLVFAVGSRRRALEDVRLFAFDAATGALRWERPLAYGHQETNLFGNPVKEFSAGVPSVADGIVYAQTGLGCLAAVETRTGTLRWLASYAIDPIPKVQAWYIPPLRLPRMGPVAPIISGDLVVVAPGDALHVSAFDRRTGTLRWRVPHGDLETPFKTLGQVLGITRVRGKDVVIVTGKYVDARELGNGRLLARGRFEPEDTRVVGQGAIAGRTVLVPTGDGVQRFSLDQELKLLGRDPWPNDAPPGNLLPLGQVLVVAARETVQGYYSWDDVEREISRRREERPRDPEVLVEAGEIYLKGRGGPEARRAFEAALGLADPAGPLAERARRGLVASWLAEGDARAEREPVAAATAYRRALEHSVAPGERASVRLKLDEVLPPKSPERIENLELLYEESGKERGRDEDGGALVPIGPVTLLKLSNVEAEAGHAVKAVAALQRLLREQGDVQLGAETVADVARRGVAALIERFGPAAYAEEESRARTLMGGDAPGGDALERVLREYPNASVVPTALLGLGRRRLAEGRAAEAAERFRQVLARHPERPEALPALALLARAYGLAGALGGRRAALAALAERLGPGRVTLEEREWTAAAWAAEQLARAPEPLPVGPHRGVAPPLTERAFEPPVEDEITVPVAIAEDEAEPSPLALTNRGTSRVQAYDLLGSQTAWGLDDVVVQKSAYALGTLVVGLRGEWRGLDPATGQTRWERQEPDTVVETVMARGQVVSWGQQTAGGRSRRRLTAMDPVTGEPLWSTALGTDHVSGLRAAGPFVLLTRGRHDGNEMRQWVLVIDALTGTLRREIPFPAGRDARDLVAGPLLLQSAPDSEKRRAVTAVELATGMTRWTRALPIAMPVTALVGDGPRAWVLQSDGTLTSLATADGAVLGTTRLSVGPNARANPAFGSEPHVADGRFTLLASAVNGRPSLLSFEAATGRLAWEVDADTINRSQQQALVLSGDRFVLLLAGLDEDQTRRVVVRIVDAASGRVEQRLEPEVRPSAGVVAMDGGFGTLVVLTTGGTSVYGTAPEGAATKAPEPAPAPPPGPSPAPPPVAPGPRER